MVSEGSTGTPWREAARSTESMEISPPLPGNEGGGFRSTGPSYYREPACPPGWASSESLKITYETKTPVYAGSIEPGGDANWLRFGFEAGHECLSGAQARQGTGLLLSGEEIHGHWRDSAGRT